MVKNLTKNFGQFTAVDNVSFKVDEGELIAFLGPSGCGKTTILRMIAGLERPDNGDIYFDEDRVTDLPPNLRKIGFVFQRPSMFPHMTALQNITWGLKLQKWPKYDIRNRALEVLKLVRLEGYENRRFNQLSGGQAQRVVIARALAPDPKVLLLDEPLSALDAKLRDELKEAIVEIHRATKKTTIFVTHDQSEAFTIASRVLVMNQGKIAQIGSPLEVYQTPNDYFIASFIGTNNIFDGEICDIEQKKLILVKVNGAVLRAFYRSGFSIGDQVRVSLRADDFDVVSDKERNEYLNSLELTIEKTYFTGSLLAVDALWGDEPLRIHVGGSKRHALFNQIGTKFTVGFGPVALVPSDINVS